MESYQSAGGMVFTSFMAVIAFFVIAGLLIFIARIVGKWTVFEKAGEAGWASLIPFYSDYILFKIAYGEGWMFLTRYIPCLNVVFTVLVYSRLAKRFGIDSDWYVVGLWLMSWVFMPIIGFSKEYTYTPFKEKESSGDSDEEDKPIYTIEEPNTEENPPPDNSIS